MAKKQKNLSIFDRILIDKIFKERGDQFGDLNDVRISFNISNKIEITDEEIEQFEIQEFQVGNQVIKNWNDSNEEKKSFQFSSKERQLLKKLIEERKIWEADKKAIEFIKNFDVSIKENISDGNEDNEVIALNVFDRLFLRRILEERRGSLRSYNDIPIALSLRDKIFITNEYVKRNKIVEDEDGNMEWDKKAIPENTTFTQKELSLLKSLLEEKQNWPADPRVIALVEKFGVTLPEIEEEDEDEDEDELIENN